MGGNSLQDRILNWVFSFKGLQCAAVFIYGVLSAVTVFQRYDTGVWNPVVVVSTLSFIVMFGRLLWTRHKGLWGNKYSQAVKKKHLTLWAPAFLPERTAVVPVIVIAYLSVLRPDAEGFVNTIFALLVTGGLTSALITSPNTIVEVVDAVDAAQRAQDNSRRAAISASLKW